MKTKQVVARYVDVMALVVKAPRGTHELASLAEMSREAIRRLMIAMEAEGLVTKRRLRTGYQWTWAK